MTKQIKRRFMRIFFTLEVFVIFFFYLFGAQGFPVLMRLNQENVQLEHEIEKLFLEIQHLENIMKQWDEYAFYKEKFAREQLHMARSNDQIYYFSRVKGLS